MTHHRDVSVHTDGLARAPTLHGGPTRVLGHRGIPTECPENTRVGLRRAIERGADGVEIDLLYTKDGELVAAHDWELSRLVGTAQLGAEVPEKSAWNAGVREWRVRDFTRAELRRLKVTAPAPEGARPDYRMLSPEYGIPSFEELVSLFAELRDRTERPLTLYVEIKTHPRWMTDDDTRRMVDRVVETLRAAGVDRREHGVWLQSFDARVMERLASRVEVAELPKSLLVGSRPGLSVPPHPVDLVLDEPPTEAQWRRFLVEEVVGRHAAIVHGWKVLFYHLMEGRGIDVVGTAHRLGLEVHAFTFRDARFRTDYAGSGLAAREAGFGSAADEYMFFFRSGFDAVMSDDVAAALDARQQCSVQLG